METKKEKILIYFVAFGQECLSQFKLCRETLRGSNVNIALITDQSLTDDLIAIYKVDSVQDVKEQYIYRVKFEDYIDITPYDRVWYMDCDFLVFEDFFSIESDAIIISREPKWTMGHDCFASALSHDERVKYYHLPAINGGLYSVPKRYFKFFKDYEVQVERFKTEHPDINIPEQQVLNAMFARKEYDFELIEIGFPEKGVTGREWAYHFACYQFKDKLELMRKAWELRTK